jgi:tetratricopeptide (TPR) repeat protein
MRVPYRLRKIETPAPVTGILLLGTDVGELLSLCMLLQQEKSAGEATLPPVYDARGTRAENETVEGGFLVKLAHPTRIGFPGALRLRGLGRDLYLPADAELIPPLLDDEVAGLGTLIFLPGGRCLAYDRAAPLSLADLIRAPRRRDRPWQAMPTPPARAERLSEIQFNPEQQQADEILRAGGAGIGEELPRPADAGTLARTAGQTQAGVGQGLVWLGNKLGWQGLVGLGQSLISGALQRVPRLSERVLGQQEAALRELLRQFRTGKLEEALRRALPLGSGTQRGGTPAQNAQLPTHSTGWNLGALLGRGRGPASIWYGGQDVQRELAQEYRKAAQQAQQRGDYRRAAFIHGVLLGDYSAAASVLASGGLHHDAAILYLEKLGNELLAAREFERAGEIDRAVELYRRNEEHVQAGDLLHRVGEEEAALLEYQTAAELLIRRQQHYVQAGELLLTRAGRPDLARGYFQRGWERRSGLEANACLLRLTDLAAEEETPQTLLALVAEAESYYSQSGSEYEPGRFFNHLAQLARRDNLLPVRDDLVDRARLGLAGQVRQRAARSRTPGNIISTLFGQSGQWDPAVTSDASYALNAALRVPTADITPPRSFVRSWLRPDIVPRGDHVRDTIKVSAVCAAASGTLFVGFEDGHLSCWNPETGSLFHLPRRMDAVTALATDALGNLMMATRTGGGEISLTGYHYQQNVHLADPPRQLPGSGPYFLSNIVLHEGQAIVGAWNGDWLDILPFSGGLPLAQVRPALLGSNCIGVVLRQGLLRPQWGLGILFFDTGGVWFSNPFHEGTRTGEPPVWNYLRLGWSWANPPGSSLELPVISWLEVNLSQVELSGISPEGELYWSLLELRTGQEKVLATQVMEGPERFRAVAFLGPGRLAGITASGIRWLRRGLRHLAITGTTRVNLGRAEAAFHSPVTNEILVICQDGELVRVPVPG